MSYGPDGVGGPRPTSTSSNSDAAAQEAARRAAEQRAKEAAEARQHAAEAQRKAIADQQAAEAARNANKTAQGDKTQAKSELDQAQSAMDSFNRNLDQRGPRPGFEQQQAQLQKTLDAAKTKFANASTAADKAQSTQDSADATAKSSRQAALDSANGALSAEKTANTAAQSAGQAQPYADANQVKDVFDAGSLDGAAQERLFGAKSVVTPEEAAQSDAQTVQQTTQSQGPQAGAAALEQQMQANPDPAYRKALLDQSQGTLGQIALSLGDAPRSNESVAATVKSLANVAQMGGPDAQKSIANVLVSGGNVCTTDGKEKVASDRAIQALNANASDPNVQALAGSMASSLRASGQYDKADAIAKANPAFAQPAQATKGQQQANASVQVTTVGQERSQLETGANTATNTARQQADQVFAAANDPSKLPKGASAVPGQGPSRAEIDQRDDQGNITQRTIAIRNGNDVTLQRITYDQGKATMQSTSTGPNGEVHTAQAQWNAQPSKDPQDIPSIDSLKNSRDPSVSMQQQDITHQDGKLVDHEYVQGPTGITDTTKSYYQQSKGDACHSGNGIKDDFEGKFSDSQPVDVVDTHTVNIPAGGQNGPDGKPLSPTESDSSTFSQGNLRLERDAGTQTYKVDSGKYNNCFHPSAADIGHIDDIDGVDKGDKGPVQWQLEENHGNTYDAQTFVEGHTDLTTHTHRVATGNSVTEDITGKVPSKDGKSTVDISSHTDQTYAADGSLAHLHKDEHAPDGSHTVTNFDRTTKPGPNGLEVDEHTNVSKTGSDGKTNTVDRSTQSLLSKQGVQLISSDETVTGPDGTKGRTLIDKSGQHSFINGTAVDDPNAIAAYSPDAQALVTQSGTDTLKEAKDFLVKGGSNALKLVNVGRLNQLSAAEGADASAIDQEFRNLLANKFGGANVDTALRVTSGAGGLTGVAAGLVGVVSSTGELIDGIRNQDIPKIAAGVVGDVTNGLAIKNGGQAFYNAVKGLETTPETNLGWLAKLPGISEEGAEAAGDFATKFGGPITAFIGVGLSGFQLYQAIQGGNGYKIAEASVGLAGASAVAAIGIGAAIGSIEPGVGTLIGAGIGLAVFGVQELIGLFDHSDTDIAKVDI